jgi:hypothetical protein
VYSLNNAAASLFGEASGDYQSTFHFCFDHYYATTNFIYLLSKTCWSPSQKKKIASYNYCTPRRTSIRQLTIDEVDQTLNFAFLHYSRWCKLWLFAVMMGLIREDTIDLWYRSRQRLRLMGYLRAK